MYLCKRRSYSVTMNYNNNCTNVGIYVMSLQIITFELDVLTTVALSLATLPLLLVTAFNFSNVLVYDVRWATRVGNWSRLLGPTTLSLGWFCHRDERICYEA